MHFLIKSNCLGYEHAHIPPIISRQKEPSIKKTGEDARIFP
jgi:hypothetical protein